LNVWAKLLTTLRKSPQSGPTATTKSYENPQHFSGTIVAQTPLGGRAATLKTFTPLLTHSFKPENISDAYRLFGERSDGVLRIAIQP
jgi:hypothetical protein